MIYIYWILLIKFLNVGSDAKGIIITGSNQNLKYLIIENSSDNGIWISRVRKTLDYIIQLYN